MEFGLLGPLRVAAGGGELTFPARQRTVLAVLLLRANQIVTVDTLAGVLWDGEPPPGARNTVQGYIKLIRQKLGPQDSQRLVTRAPGYLLTVGAGELDTDRFTALGTQARAAAGRGDWPAAAARLAEALSLWRGEPLADVPAPALVRDEAPRLADLRLTALEARIDADLHLGRHAGLTGELRQLATSHPLRERFSGQLMLALYRCGRQAEALAAFRQARQVLRDELGIEPGPELARLHERMLAADPELSAGPDPADTDTADTDTDMADTGPAGPAGEAVEPPAQLPPDTVDFTGRDAQVAMLRNLLDAEPDAHRSGAVVISAVSGMGGIGKTALAIHAAHQLRGRFPDGQLYVSLQGATAPLSPGEILARFLRAIGVPDAAIPADDAERAARYRTEMATRRMLVVLDDARDAAQVRPLLPGTAGCGVIVTSRSTLPDLAGALVLDLDVLDPADARALFTSIIGPARAAAEPDALTSVLDSCAGLPLAVRIAASRLRARPGWSITHLAARLADERTRLAELASGDLGIRASFQVSYQTLPPAPALVFRRLGLARATELPLAAIGELAGLTPEHTASQLDTLTDAHLVTSPVPDRYRQHDLLRTYARELAAQHEPEAEQQAALERMLRWYGLRAYLAARQIRPTGRFPDAMVPAQITAAEVTDHRQALDWFETELAGLRAATEQAADLGLHHAAAQIGVMTWGFFQRTPYTEDWLAITQAAVASARHLGDDATLSWLLNSLGQVNCKLGRFTPGHDCLTEALDLKRGAGDQNGEAAVLNSLAVSLSNQDRFEEALARLRPALTIFGSLGQRGDVGIVQHNMGVALLGLKRHEEAIEHLDRAVAIARETCDPYGQGISETTLGKVHHELGQLEDAVRHYRQGLAVLQPAARDHPHQVDALCRLGDALDALGRAEEAREVWRTVIPALDRLGDPRAAELLPRLGQPRLGQPRLGVR